MTSAITEKEIKVNKFQHMAKPSPLLRVEEDIEAMNGGTSTIPFHYLNEEDYIENRAKGIGSEFEHYLNIQVSTIARLRDPILFGDCSGALTDYNPFVKAEALKSHRPKTSVFDLPGSYRNMNINKSKLREIYLKVIQANNSSLLASEPEIDKTINENTGGPEIVFAPVTLKALSLAKIELTRILYYAKLFDARILGDTSLHFHVSADIFGDTSKSFKETLVNVAWFMFENDKFMESFSGRIDDGVDMSSLRYMLNDPLGELTKEALKRRLFETKGDFIVELMSEGYIDRKKSFQVGSAKSDDRIKGFLNMVVKDKYDTVEIRWFGSTLDPDIYISFYEFCFALATYCRLQNIHGTKECESLKGLVEMVADRRSSYPHLWNRFIVDSFTKDYIPEEERVAIPVINYEDPSLIEKVIDYSIYDEPFVKKYSEPTIENKIGKGTESEEETRTEVGRAEELLESIKTAEKETVEQTAEPLIEAMPPIDSAKPVTIDIEEEVIYECALTGYSSKDKREFVLTVNDEYINTKYYHDRDLNEEESPLQLKEEYCHTCGVTIPADEEGWSPAEEFEGHFYCDDCIDEVIDNEDLDDEELGF